MKNKSNTHILYPVFGSLIGMGLGFLTFLLTENIIFLIVFITTGLSVGIALGQKPEVE
jgi:hypothetical protein